MALRQGVRRSRDRKTEKSDGWRESVIGPGRLE
jgi:hypothetical protein